MAQSHDHICPDCGDYFICKEEPCVHFYVSCTPCVDSDSESFDFDRIDSEDLNQVLALMAGA